jgi:hypothetical protein
MAVAGTSSLDQRPETQLDPTPGKLILDFGARPFKTHETTAQIFGEP